MGTFFQLDEQSQERIARAVGERVAELLNGQARWNAADEHVLIAGRYGEHPLRVTLDATFGGLMIEIVAEPSFPSFFNINLSYEHDGRSQSGQGEYRDHGFESPLERDDHTFYLSEHVSAGDDVPQAAHTMRILELLPDELRQQLLTALEHNEGHFNAYSSRVQLRCGREVLDQDDVDDHVRRYIHLSLELHAAFQAAMTSP